jgi:alkyldihydroxyacetonephosphate synthase
VSDPGLVYDRLIGAVGAQHASALGPRVEVRPGSQAEIGDVLRVARETGAQVGVGVQAGIAIDLARMTNVLHLDETSLLISVQAGITVSALERIVGERGLTLGPLPPTSRGRTVGALLSAPRPSEAAPQRGRLPAACAAVTGVTADGSEITTRLAPRKATGPDFLHALVGARGTLGIITSATLRLSRRGEARETAAWELPTAAAAIRAARKLLVAGARPLEVTVALAPSLLQVVLDGPVPLADAERALAGRLAVAEGGRPVKPSPPPAWTRPPHERELALDALEPTLARLGHGAEARLCGWHRAGAALVDPDRAPELPAAHPLALALKKRLDPDGHLPAWPGA